MQELHAEREVNPHPIGPHADDLIPPHDLATECKTAKWRAPPATKRATAVSLGIERNAFAIDAHFIDIAGRIGAGVIHDA